MAPRIVRNGSCRSTGENEEDWINNLEDARRGGIGRFEVSVWPGCKGSSTTGGGSGEGSGNGSVGSQATGTVSALIASPGASAASAMTNPTTSRFWGHQSKLSVNTQAHYPPAATQTKLATAYGKKSLYLALINTGRGPWYKPGAAPASLWRRDCVQVWLDTSRLQNGTNFYEITIAPDGQVNQVWHRSSTPPAPDANGRINLLQPYSLIPWKAKGLQVKTFHGIYQGQPSWNVVVRIPLNGLPRPLQVTPRQNERLRANVIRYAWQPVSDSSKRRLVQFNLFPVAKESQAMAPYCMGRLILSPPDQGNLTLAPAPNR